MNKTELKSLIKEVMDEMVTLNPERQQHMIEYQLTAIEEKCKRIKEIMNNENVKLDPWMIDKISIAFHNIDTIANKFMFNSKQLVNPISIDMLSRDLKELNNIFGHIRSISISPVSIPSPIVSVAPKPISIASSKSKSRSKSRSSVVVPGGPGPVPKKTRKRRVVCDDAKKAHCRSIGKVCNEATGRCNKI
jgi:hypothetical protein